MTDAPHTLSNNQKLAADIREAMVILAKIIRKYGDAPWPLMERLQREFKAVEDREALLDNLLQKGAVVSSKLSNLTSFRQALCSPDARF